MATRRTTRRLGNENAVQKSTATSTTNTAGNGIAAARAKEVVKPTLAAAKPAPVKRSTRSSTGASKEAASAAKNALTTKTGNKASAGTAAPAAGAVKKQRTVLTDRSATEKNKAAGAANSKASQTTVDAPAKKPKPRTRSSTAADQDGDAIMLPAGENEPEDFTVEVDSRPIKALKGAKAAAKGTTKPSNLPRPSQVVTKADAKRLLEDTDDEGDDGAEVNAAADEAEAELALEQAKPRRARNGKRAKIAKEPAKDAGWQDLDIGDEDDPLMVTSYVNEVYEYLKEIETQTMADKDYMQKQNEVNWRMRGILVDWLIEVHGKFRLLPETIFLATNIVDRFLSIRVVSLVKFQLVGITALLLASKYEEIICPSIQSFLYMTDGGYTDDEMLRAERYILQMIGFDFSYPNPINFLRRISKADAYDIQSRTIAKYFMEMTCVDRKFLCYPPSIIAAAAAWLARKMLDRGAWDANLIHYSTYTEKELLPCAQKMLDYVVRMLQLPEAEHPNFHRKYAARKFYKASETVKSWVQENYLDCPLKCNFDESSVDDEEPLQTCRLEEWAEM